MEEIRCIEAERLEEIEIDVTKVPPYFRRKIGAATVNFIKTLQSTPEGMAALEKEKALLRGA